MLGSLQEAPVQNWEAVFQNIAPSVEKNDPKVSQNSPICHLSAHRDNITTVSVPKESIPTSIFIVKKEESASESALALCLRLLQLTAFQILIVNCQWPQP